MVLRLVFLKLFYSAVFFTFLIGCNEFTTNIEAEKIAVREVWDEINKAFLVKDWEGYSDYFSHSLDFQMVHSAQNDWIKGWNSFQQRYEPIIKAEGQWHFKTIRFDVSISPKADAAWAMVEFVFSEENGPEYTNIEFVVFNKIDGRWKVASALVAPSGTTSSN